MKTGKIIQVLGPVVDVEFENQELPAIRDALEVQNGDKKCVMEVAQHIGNHVVRCIMLAPPNRPILPPFAYGARRSITLIPVSRISTAGFCSSNVGGSL